MMPDEEKKELIKATAKELYYPHGDHEFNLTVSQWGFMTIIMQYCNKCQKVVGFILLDPEQMKDVLKALL